MIQDDDNKVISSISIHTDRVRKDIFTLCKDAVQSLYTKAFKYKKVREVIITYFFINKDIEGIEDVEAPNHLYVTLSIPGEYHLDIKRKNCYKIRREITEKLYLNILERVTKVFPSTEHDLHHCEIDRIELLDGWSKYEAQL